MTDTAAPSTSTSTTTTTTAARTTTPTTTSPPVAPDGGPSTPADAEGPYPVTEVVDGDTMKVSVQGKVMTLRLIGIDTPETKDPGRPVECWGPEATGKADELAGGQQVRISYDPSQGRLDRYDRTLAYVWLADGRSFEWVMIDDGFAAEYTYSGPYRYQSDFKVAESQADGADRGLWSPATCDGDLDRAATPAPAPAPAPAPDLTAAPEPGPPATTPAGTGCDPNYSGACVPPYPPDVDCRDISGPVTVIGGDPHHLDADGDGAGCKGNR